MVARHEFQGAMGAEVEDCVCLEYLLEVGVVRGKAVVRRGALREEEAHRVALVAERRLDADEDVAEALAVDEELGAVGVEVARGLA